MCMCVHNVAFMGGLRFVNMWVRVCVCGGVWLMGGIKLPLPHTHTHPPHPTPTPPTHNPPTMHVCLHICICTYMHMGGVRGWRWERGGEGAHGRGGWLGCGEGGWVGGLKLSTA